MKSGSRIVDEIYQINFEGNITPHSWYQHSLLRTEGGKPNLVAITLLADLVYWYRPVIIKDEATNRIIALRRKFRYHRVFKDYQQWGNYFGFTKRQVQDAVAFLKRRGLIIVEIRPFTFDTGVTVGTVVFLEPILNALKAVTFDVTQVTFNSDPPLSDGDPTFESDQPLLETEPPSRFNENGVTFNSDYSTESSPKESSKNPQQQIAVDVSDSSESASASSAQSESIKPDNRVLEIPQFSGAGITKPSASQKRARATAQKQFEAGQTSLPQVAAVAPTKHAANSEVVEKLLALRTGADGPVIARYASMNPQHAELVAQYFPGTRENTQEYWDNYNARKGTDFTRANGLIQRLKNPQWEPPQLRAERIREENAEQARTKREREASEREVAQRAEKENAENMARINDDTVSEYRSLPLEAREAVREKVWHCSNFLRDRARELAPKGALPPLLEGAPESALLDGWTRQHTEYGQWAVTLRQAMLDVTRERPELFEDEEFEDFEDLPPVSEDEYTALIVERLTIEVLDDVIGIEELDTRRAKQGPAVEEDDELWEKICAGVKLRVLDQAA